MKRFAGWIFVALTVTEAIVVVLLAVALWRR
jgi:hypothetical protein